MASGSISKIDDLIKNHYYWCLSTALEVEEKNQVWTLVLDHPMVPANKRMQVRPTKKLVRSGADVNEYRQMMKLGDQFPPVIITRDGWLVDGNTRMEAALELGWDSFPALVLSNVLYSGLSPTSPVLDTLKQLGAGANRKHGQKQSNADIAVLIEQIQPRVTVAEIVQNMHVSKSFATMVWNAARARRHAVSLDIPLKNEFSNSLMKLFGGKIDKYTDPVWKSLFRLSQDAHLKYEAVDALMHGVEQYRDEAERLSYLDREREQYAPVIKSGVSVPMEKPRRMKQALGVINKKEDSPELFVEKDGRKKVRVEYLQSMMDAESNLRKMIFLQEEWNRTVDTVQE